MRSSKKLERTSTHQMAHRTRMKITRRTLEPGCCSSRQPVLSQTDMSSCEDGPIHARTYYGLRESAENPLTRIHGQG